MGKEVMKMSERNAKGKTPEDYGFRMPNKKVFRNLSYMRALASRK